ncbi:MAG: rhomboid family protein [Candidatus Hydrogenedentes bacterium]|nr:rhomboid family protein [Candidatus Hydrogenedentota bacterium]
MGSLTLTRCFNHGQREAVARCPSCRRHYCRECVTEHDHKLLCASCIQALASAQVATERRPWPIIPTLQLLVALFVLWLSFYGVGRALLLVPSQFHQIETENSDDPARDQPDDEVADALASSLGKGAR